MVMLNLADVRSCDVSTDYLIIVTVYVFDVVWLPIVFSKLMMTCAVYFRPHLDD